MQDEIAIQNVINTYSQAASAGDWDRAIGTFLPDAQWDIPHLGMRLVGHGAIREALTAMVATMDYVLQLNSPALIDLNGDTASARSSIRECGKTMGKNEGFEYLGFYQDELARTDQGWKFTRRVFEGVGTHFFPLIRGEAH